MHDTKECRQTGRLVPHVQQTDDRANHVAWLAGTHVPDLLEDHAVMNPLEARAKYSRKHQPLTEAVLWASFEGKERRLQINSTWCSFPLSLAVAPAPPTGCGRQAAIDVDAGGTNGVRRVLGVCSAHGLWAYAQLGESVDHAGEGHQGGHVRIPFAGPIPSSLLHDLARRVMAVAQVQGDAFPYLTHAQELRLPLMPHLRAPGGPRRFPLLLPCGELIDAANPWDSLARLRAAWQENAAETLTAALDTLPLLPVAQRQSTPRSKVYIQKHDNVIGWYNEHHDLRG